MQSNIENVSRDYAKILQSADLEKEINPLCTNIEDMLARLDEFETLLASFIDFSACGINGMMPQCVRHLGFADSFEQLKTRIDGLEQFVGVVSANLSEVERSVDIAEEELHVTDYSLKGLLLKPLKAKLGASDSSTFSSLPRSNLVEEEYQPVEIYKSDDYFGKSEEDNNVAK
ncbi:GD17633 [Drosophila simulans]|uniref:GD17633 n=1 Tax=Drosophila simulans TaxID=7240 RepID=B4NT23_DROSI|nr:GD17633 [Drosophila simulans]